MAKRSFRKSRKRKKKKLHGRARRISEAREWVNMHRAKPANMLKRYRKHFGVDWECAIADLVELGVKFDPDYLSHLRVTIKKEYPNEHKHSPITRLEIDYANGIEYDETFAYIAGYTPAGFPYGITWEEMEAIEAAEKIGENQHI